MYRVLKFRRSNPTKDSQLKFSYQATLEFVRKKKNKFLFTGYFYELPGKQRTMDGDSTHEKLNSFSTPITIHKHRYESCIYFLFENIPSHCYKPSTLHIDNECHELKSQFSNSIEKSGKNWIGKTNHNFMRMWRITIALEKVELDSHFQTYSKRNNVFESHVEYNRR